VVISWSDRAPYAPDECECLTGGGSAHAFDTLVLVVTRDLRITSLFSCVAHGFKTRVGMRF
jgi:hypothetical protein